MVTITITYFLYLVTAGIILLFFAILAIGKDFKILDSNYIDNIIGIAEYSNAIVHAFQKFKAPFSGKIVHIFPEQSAVI